MDGRTRARNSLRTRLTLIVAGILVTAVLAVTGVAVREQQRQLRRALETKGATLAEFTAEVTPLAILSLNFVDMNNDVRKLVLTDEEAVYAVLLNDQGIPLAYHFKPVGPAAGGEVRALVEAREPLGAAAAARRSGRILEVSAPITAGGRAIGTVVLGLSLDVMRRAASVQIGMIGLVVAIVLAASMVLILLVLRSVLQPIQALTAAVAQISAGDLDVEVSGLDRADELGVLSRGFESMAAQLRGLITRLEQRVSERTAQLQTANEELESFAYSVSHDLRAPLRHVDGYVELLRKRLEAAPDDRVRYYMESISKEARRMGELIDNLLSFSRMGRAGMTRAPVDLGALVREVIGELGPDAGGRAITWRIRELPVVTGDRAMLRAAFANLVGNALKFTRVRDPAEIEIGTVAGLPGEDVVFVRDNGVGFDPAYAHKLFGVFQRLHRAEEFEGTGIGLANVRRIVTRHGGRTWAEGRVDQGATFFLSLPRPAPSAPADEERGPAVSAG
jgi:signal transduction histidine kinase